MSVDPNHAQALMLAGQTTEAQRIYEKLVAQLSASVGPSHKETLTAKGNLAVALYRRGRYLEALEIQEEVRRRSVRKLGLDNPATLKATSNLAWTYIMLSRLGDAQRLFRQVLRIVEKAAEPSDAANWTARENLAWVLQQRGDLKAAGVIQEGVLKYRTVELGATNIATIDAMATFAATRFHQGRLSEAHDLQVRVRDALIHHPDQSVRMLVAKENLAITLYSLAKLQAAERLQREVLKLRIEADGDSQPAALLAMTNLAVTLQELGELEEARRLLKKVIEIRSKDEEDPLATASAQLALADVMKAMGDLSAAQELELKALARRTKVHGTSHPHTLAAMTNLAMTLYRGERIGEARELLARVVALRVRRSGKDHPETLVAKSFLAGAMQSQGEMVKAGRLLRNVLDACRRTLGDAHTLTNYARQELAGNFHARRLWSRAQALDEQVVSHRRRLLGMKHPDVLAAMANQVSNLSQTAHLDACAALTRRLIRLILKSRPIASLMGAEATEKAMEVVKRLVLRGVKVTWRQPFAELSEMWVGALHAAPPAQAGGMWEAVTSMHETWLSLCLHEAPDDVPIVLAALQGREMARAMHEDLRLRSVTGTSSAAGDAYMALMANLHAKRIELAAITNRRVTDTPDFRQGRSSSLPESFGLSESRTLERALVAEHDALVASLQDCAAELKKTDPTFELTSSYAAITVSQLASRLSEGEVLALLFSHEADQGEAHFVSCITHRGEHSLIQIHGFSDTLQLCDRSVNASRSGALGRRCRGAFGAREPSDDDRLADPSVIAAAIRTQFWSPLRDAFPDASTWHVATHQALHNIPLNSGLVTVEEARSARFYPGIAFFVARSAAAMELSGAIIHVDAAWTTVPIPMVEADARMIQEQLPGSMLSRGADTLGRLRDPSTARHAFCAAAHGAVRDDTRRAAQVAILLDAEAKADLDATTWLTTGARPPVAMLATCVGARLSEPLGGEPFGLVSALLLRGTRSVVGCLAAVPDFYMPLLTGLFWAVYRDSTSANEALARAKRGLLDGAWPPGFDALVRTAYGAAMSAVLTRIAGGGDDATRLLPTVAEWPLPRSVEFEFFSPLDLESGIAFADAHCRTERSRETLIEAVIDRLILEREELPRDAVEHMNTWVQVFGDDPSR